MLLITETELKSPHKQTHTHYTKLKYTRTPHYKTPPQTPPKKPFYTLKNIFKKIKFPHIKKPNLIHIHIPQNPYIQTTTHYKTQKCTYPHITKRIIHTNHTLKNPYIHKTTHYKTRI